MVSITVKPVLVDYANSLLKSMHTPHLISSTPFSDTLRKTVVLASRLNVSALSNWAKNELNGYKYKGTDNLPDYRIVPCATYVDYLVPTRIQLHMVSNVRVNIQEDEFQLMKVRDGIKTLEDIIEKGKSNTDANMTLDFEPDLFEVLADLLAKNEGKQLQKAQRRAPISAAAQIIDSAKTRLLDFVLELDNLAEVSGERIKVDRTQATHLFQQIIMGTTQFSIKENNTMTVFDQRGQNVNYQYNAAGDINIEAIQNQSDLVEELGKLKYEIEKAKLAGTIDEDDAIDAEYQVQKAIQEAKKSGPDKKSFIEHIGKAKELLEDTTAAAGLVTALLKAVKIAKDLL